MSVVARTAALFRPRTSGVQVGPIGVDIALEAVHLVQLEYTEGRRPSVRDKVSLSIDGTRDDLLQQPLQFRSLVKRALASHRFKGNKAVLALPSAMFRTVSVNYQMAASEKSEAEAILRVMKDRLDGNLQDYVLDYMTVGGRSKSEEKLALVAVSDRNPVISFLEVARKAGLDVSALEIGPLAISRLTSALSQDSEASTTLVVNSGRRASYLTLISGNDLLFDQEVAVGENSLVEHICATLDMSEATARHLLTRTGVHPGTHKDAISHVVDDSGLFNTLSEILKPQFMKLVDEIKRAFIYAASETRGRGVTQVYLMGSIARWPGSDEMLSKLSGASVAKIPDPLALFPSDQEGKSGDRGAATHSAPEIAVATGLALRGINING